MKMFKLYPVWWCYWAQSIMCAKDNNKSSKTFHFVDQVFSAENCAETFGY